MRNIRWSLLALPIVLLPAAMLSAQSSVSVEDRLRALEQQVQGLAQENVALKQQLGWKEATAPVLPLPGGKEAKLVVGGFLQGQAEFGRAADPRWNGVKDRFFFRRARLYLAGGFAEDFDFKAELDLQGNTLGAATGQLARANEIYINWRRYAAANLRFGQLKPAFGGEVLLSDTKMLTIERTLFSDRLGDSRQLALGALGELPGKMVSYYATVANGNGPNSSANDNSAFQQAARVVFTPLATARDKVQLGVDGLWSNDSGLAKADLGLPANTFTGARAMTGADLQWTHGSLDLVAEWMHGNFRSQTTPRFQASGWQVTAAWFFIPARLQAVVRTEQFDPNTAVGGNTIGTNTFGLNYSLRGDDIKFMLNYLDGCVPGSTTDGGRWLTRVQVIF